MIDLNGGFVFRVDQPRLLPMQDIKVAGNFGKYVKHSKMIIFYCRWIEHEDVILQHTLCQPLQKTPHGDD